MEKALILCSVVSMVKQFNMENIELLQELGYEVHVISNFESPGTIPRKEALKFKEKLSELKVTFFDINIQRQPFNYANFRAYMQIKKIISKNNYKVIHCQSPVGGVLARFAAIKNRKKGTKVIYTAHGFHFYKGASMKNWLIYYPLEKFLSMFTDVIITINKEDYNRSQNFFSREKIYIPGIGINLKAINNIKKEEKCFKENFLISNDEFIVTSVGELNKNKNHETVIKALSLVNIPFKYIICGSGEEEENLWNIAKNLGLESRVIIAGYRDDVINIVKNSDLFVFPSKREGLPVSLMEAMACGKPVVCSKIRGNTDLIDEAKGGYLISNNSIEGYSKKILEIYNSKKIQKEFSYYNSDKIREFDIDVIDKKMSNIYSNVR